MINTESAIKDLVEIDAIFRNHNIRYWLQDGTLLGLYRDRAFIPHDNDVDIGIRWKDFTREVFASIIANGFDFRASHGRLEESLVINFRKRGIPIDIYFYYNDNSRFYHSAAYGKARKYRVDFSYKEFDTKAAEFLGYNFLIPEDPLYFIETKYGKGWNLPDTEWDSNQNPLNRTPTDIITTKAESREAFKKWLNNIPSGERHDRK